MAHDSRSQWGQGADHAVRSYRSRVGLGWQVGARDRAGIGHQPKSRGQQDQILTQSCR